MQFNNLTIRLLELVRKASSPLIRDFYEIDKLKGSGNALRFVSIAQTRTEKILENELSRSFFTSMLPPKVSWFQTPIEGKMNFMHGMPYFCITLGMFVNDILTTVVIDSPIFKETCFAEKGFGTTLQNLENNFKLRVGKVNNPQYALIGYNSPIKLGVGYPRIIGSNFLNIVNVAAGKFDACILKIPEENQKNILSIAHLIMNESKGKASLCSNYVIASNVELHEDLCHRLSKCV